MQTIGTTGNNAANTDYREDYREDYQDYRPIETIETQ